jgi:hypothetical protein
MLFFTFRNKVKSSNPMSSFQTYRGVIEVQPAANRILQPRTWADTLGQRPASCLAACCDK